MKFEGRKICDICKSDITNNTDTVEIKWKEKIQFLKGEEMEMHADFCKYCLQDFKKWIGNNGK